MEPVVNNTKRFVNLLSRIDAPVSVEDLMYELEQLQEKHDKLNNKFQSLLKIYNEMVDILLKNDDKLQDRIIDLEEQINKKIIYSTDIVTSTIEEITYVDDYEFAGEDWEKYLVKLEEYDSYFYLSKRINRRVKTPAIGDRISHKIEGERIKEWHKLK